VRELKAARLTRQNRNGNHHGQCLEFCTPDRDSSLRLCNRRTLVCDISITCAGHNLYERDPYDKRLIMAIIIALLGKENEKEHDRCEKGKAAFVGCISMKSWMNGCCSNCKKSDACAQYSMFSRRLVPLTQLVEHRNRRISLFSGVNLPQCKHLSHIRDMEACPTSEYKMEPFCQCYGWQLTCPQRPRSSARSSTMLWSMQSSRHG
jgi:hypothetical protein